MFQRQLRVHRRCLLHALPLHHHQPRLLAYLLLPTYLLHLLLALQLRKKSSWPLRCHCQYCPVCHAKSAQFVLNCQPSSETSSKSGSANLTATSKNVIQMRWSFCEATERERGSDQQTGHTNISLISQCFLSFRNPNIYNWMYKSGGKHFGNEIFHWMWNTKPFLLRNLKKKNCIIKMMWYEIAQSVFTLQLPSFSSAMLIS